MKYGRALATLAALLLLCVLFACTSPTPQPQAPESMPPISPVPIVCRAEGELIEGQATALRYAAPTQSIEQYIYEALMAEQDEIDISAYGITPEQVTNLYTDVMNTHPDLFFVQPGISYTYTTAGKVVTLVPSYAMTGRELAAARADCTQALDGICAGVDTNWSDFEIALYLHDYLCLNFEYDTSYEIYDMYGFLTKGRGVCQAYTLTYMALLARFGIDSGVAVSQGMNHIWNVITLGGHPYHVDVTWDDPVPDEKGRVLHANFLRSDQGIGQTEHYGWVSDLACSSRAYEDTFLQNVTQPFSYTAGKWTYADGQARAVCEADFSTMSQKPLITVEQHWLAPGGNSYYVDAFIGAGVYRGNVIYNLPDQILAHNLQSGVTVEIPIGDLGKQQIFGLWVVGEVVYYAISDAPDGEMTYLSCDISELADYLRGDADQNGVVDGRDVTAIRRYLEGLPTVCHTGAADLDDSGAVDARDAEILRQYLVENN